MLFSLLLILLIPASSSLAISSLPPLPPIPKAASSGVCAGCTFVLKVLERISETQETPISEFLDRICNIIPPGSTRDTCVAIILATAPIIIEMVAEGVNPDIGCRKLQLCSGWEQCTMYPEMEYDQYRNPEADEATRLEQIDIFTLLTGNCHLHDPFRPDHLLPPENEDDDADWFSPYFYDRGSAWRGKDCDDSDVTIYPGRRQHDVETIHVDFNCNGIHGTDPESGKPWEEVLCDGVNMDNIPNRRGIITLGDSACAHFRIPQQLVAGDVTIEQFEAVIPAALLELDWPHLSYLTGFLPNDTTGLTPGSVNSVYLETFKRDRCNHRDLQNVCVNGETSHSVIHNAQFIHRGNKWNGTAKSGRSGEELDFPAVVLVNLIGNDVCTGSFASMTTPAAYRKNIVELFGKLDEFLPVGSHVVLISLAKGTLLYEYLHDTMHPLGASYEDFYSYLNCLGTSPCWGWMNKNVTVREMTQKRADELAETGADLVKKASYKNFKAHFIDFRKLAEDVVEWYKSIGGDVPDLAEPMDGFHPSQFGMPFFASRIFQWLDAEDPTIWGKVNPNNDRIQKIFGDQGGY